MTRISTAACLSLGTISLIVAIAFFPGWPSRAATRNLPRRGAMEACAELARGLPAPPNKGLVRVATDFNAGGWCRWGAYLAAPNMDLRVTVDGRTQFVPAERIREMFQLYRAEPGWESVLESWNSEFILSLQTEPLALQLEQSSRWRGVVAGAEYRIFGATLSEADSFGTMEAN